ncbi:MAG TPA: MFS transporter [Acidobacteriota bacterium]|nr:MFS transporter [Acidobacteriota bacterium]
MHQQRKAIRAWWLYDFANSAYATTIQATVFGPFYRSLVTSSGGSEAEATAYWAYLNSLTLLSIALIGPLLGAIGDYSGRRKRLMGVFLGLGLAATSCFVLLGDDNYLFASLLYLAATLGYASAEIYYDSFLPFICRSDEVDSVSSKGYALGYLGGGLLLSLNAWWMISPQTFGMPDVEFAVRASFLSVAFWWGFFSIPLFRRMPSDTPRRRALGEASPLLGGFRRLRRTFTHVRRHRQLLLFLLAFWIYNDGVGTVQKMAAAYGDELGFSMGQLVSALLLANFIGFPATYLYALLARRFGAKPMVLAGLFFYAVICLGAFFIDSAADFFLLAAAVGLVQGGVQALSRSIFSCMVPHTQSAEFFGFFSTSSRFAGIFGPLIFGVVAQATGSSIFSIASLVILFLGGALVLSRVDVEEGARLARLEDADIGPEE